MRSFLTIVFLLFFFPVVSNCSEKKDKEEKSQIDHKTFLMVDSFGYEKYCYSNLISLFHNVNFKIVYKKFYQITKDENIDNFDGIIFVISERFLAEANNFLVKNSVSLIRKFVQQNNKLIFLSFESPTNSNSISNLIGIKNKSWIKPIDDFFSISLRYRISYKSSLLTPDLIKKTDKEKIEQERKSKLLSKNFLNIVDEQLLTAVLPLNIDFAELINETFMPFGIYTFDLKNDNHFFFTRNRLIAFYEIAESFHVNPLDPKLREKFLFALGQSILELKLLLDGENFEFVSKILLKKIPFNLTQDYIEQEKKSVINSRDKNIPLYKWAEKGLYFGWIDFEIEWNLSRLKLLIENIKDAGLNGLWIRFNPECYFSPKGKCAKNLDKYLKQIDNFTKMMIQVYKDCEDKIPKIFIGTELSGNFNVVKVRESIYDIYAKNYSKIPTPLDFDNFWQTEFFIPITLFIENWKKSVGNGLQIGGIFFDLEMYQSSEESEYPQLSDFSNNSWEIFNKIHKIKAHSIESRIKYLYNTDLLDLYFDTLKIETKKIGQKIRELINSKIKDGFIGVYMPSLPCSWFYEGLLSGMSDRDYPIILATFNNQSFNNYSLLIKNKIYFVHIPVILLSKFQKAQDFDLLSQMRFYNDGWWLNRFNRLSDPYDNELWWSIESTPFNHDTAIKLIGEFTKKSSC